MNASVLLSSNCKQSAAPIMMHVKDHHLIQPSAMTMQVFPQVKAEPLLEAAPSHSTSTLEQNFPSNNTSPFLRHFSKQLSSSLETLQQDNTLAQPKNKNNQKMTTSKNRSTSKNVQEKLVLRDDQSGYVSYGELKRFFHLPFHMASIELRLGTMELRRVCREFNISRYVFHSACFS